MTEGISSGLVGDSILSRAAYGGGYYGQGGYGNQFASDSSNAVRINSSEKLAAQAHRFMQDANVTSHDGLSQQISDNADRNRDITSSAQSNAEFISNRDFQTQVGALITGQIARNEDASRAEFNSINRELSAVARETAKCCCEAKLLAAQNQAKTDAGLATILANQQCDSRVNDAVANAHQNAKLDTLLNERGRHHGG